jgi:hypothetical protein
VKSIPFFFSLKHLLLTNLIKKIQAFHFDWGGEYQRLYSHFLNIGIIHRIAALTHMSKMALLKGKYAT